jgi:polysaccharide export outer membrane protein
MMQRLVASVIFALILSACGGHGKYVWVQDLPPQPKPAPQVEYLIGPADQLTVTVRQDERVSAKTKVRHDGKITLGLIGDVEASGRTLPGLAQEISKRLSSFIESPIVTVSLDETAPISVTVLGEVSRTGVFGLKPQSGVLDAIAVAGGLTEFADRDNIYVLRRSGPSRIRFSYVLLVENEAKSRAFYLENGDVLMVE